MCKTLRNFTHFSDVSCSRWLEEKYPLAPAVAKNFRSVNDLVKLSSV